jgi:isopenicillin-N epimerase
VGGRSRFWLEFDWVGTADPTAALCVPEAIRFLGSLLPGGWPALRERNRGLALAARALVTDALGMAPPCPDEMIGSMAALPLPPDPATPTSAPHADPLQLQLLDRWSIEIPIISWPAPPRRVVRLSAQLYNSLDQYAALAGALSEVLPASPGAVHQR